MATQKEIAIHLDLSERRVRDILKLIDVPVRGCSVEQARIEYIRYLRKRASGHIGADGTLDLTQERAKLAKAQTEKAEIEVAKLKGSLIDADEVRRSAFNMGRIVRDRILNVPDRLAHVLAENMEPVKVRALLEQELRTAMESLTSRNEGC